MGEEDYFEDPDQEGYRSLGKMLQGSVRYTVWARSLTDLETPDGFVKLVDLSVRNGVLLYKQLIRLMMDYTCPAWRSAARSHVRRL
jgi:hypothetical protein